ncbi:hypothetical protein QJ856_gp0388 [Tupanvirus deep ocean]|uniref:Uncharacterized protein n=2 Tax=Tupanvirus TaxID=2094720 RepID=A0AC62A9M3_9VIRU|nr:hypothetical protein QJ856_gp0388 [Tupanvirus deep ocean]QKU34350.1 hypothetical protein [Tupanvirus deep ocean]
MPKYYLVHKIVNPQSDKILKILRDGSLRSSKETNEPGIFPAGLLDRIYFSLFGTIKDVYALAGITFILNAKILYERPFRYALTWTSDKLEKSILVDPKYDNVSEILDQIDRHINDVVQSEPDEIGTHEILLKDKINLHKYMVAICCYNRLSSDVIDYVNRFYPNVEIIYKIPDTATDLTKMLYKHKYVKYKTKYLNLKKEINKNQFEHNFYFLHSTTRFENLLDVLKTGVLYPGKYVKRKQRVHYGPDPSEYLYANIYFDDIKNIKKNFFNFTLLLHPKIMNENGFFFNKGWQKHPYRGPDIVREDAITKKPVKYPQTGIEIFGDDSQQEVNQKLKKIHDFLENPDLPQVFLGSEILEHEVLFDHPINLSDNNLIGVICYNCDKFYQNNKKNNKGKNYLELIREAIKDKPYQNVKIFVEPKDHLPDLDDLLIIGYQVMSLIMLIGFIQM